MKKLLLATTIMTSAAMTQAAVVNVAGTVTGTTNGSGATVSYTPAAPSFTGTFDTVTGALDWDVEDYVLNIDLAAFGWNVDLTIADSNLVGDGSDLLAGSSATVVSCVDNGAASPICPPADATSNTYVWTFDDIAGTGTMTSSSGGNVTTHEFAVSAVPVPAAAWLFGSALVGLAGIGRKRK